MSIMNQRVTERIILSRAKGDEFWDTVRDHYAHEDPRCWKFLAMFALHTTAGMSIEQISHAFGHPPGHVSRCLQIVRRELRQRFRLPREDEVNLCDFIHDENVLIGEIDAALTDLTPTGVAEGSRWSEQREDHRRANDGPIDPERVAAELNVTFCDPAGVGIDSVY